MSTPVVDIIIVNWNGREQTLACLEAVVPQAEALGDAVVTVVDNGSTDGSIAAITKRYPKLRFLPQGKNLGFTGGIAAGLARSKGRNVLFLNNDAVPQTGWLEQMVEAIESADDDVVSVAGKIVSLDGKRIDFIGGVMTFDGHAFQNGFREALGTREEPADGAEIFFPCGGNMISRREALTAIGGFDDDYFAYLEDVDFGWRSWLQGHRVLYARGGLVRHASSATSERLGNFERGVLFERNALQTVIKNYDDASLAGAAGAVLFAYLHRLHHYATTRNRGAKELSRAFGAPQKKGRGWRSRTLATIEDPLTAMQFRALDWIMKNSDRLAQKRAAVQRARKRGDGAIFEKFPLHIVPTYPGDEELMRNPLFRLLRPDLPAVEKKLGDIMRS